MRAPIPSCVGANLTTDIHVLLNTIQSPSIINSLSSASCIPVCLPKFNPAGFVYCYISFLTKDGEGGDAGSQDTVMGIDAQTPIHSQIAKEITQPGEFESNPAVTLVCICGGGEIETIRGWCDSVSQVRQRASRQQCVELNILRD